MKSITALARTAMLVAIGVVALTAPVARAAARVQPQTGRWQGRAGAASVVFTIEETAHGVRYLVRPVVYCGPDQATYFETSLFSFSQPDAWPITSNGVVHGAPLVGRFEDAHAKLKLVGAAACVPAGTKVEATPMPATPTVFDGAWTPTLAPHPQGQIGDVADLATRGEGALISADWGVYGGGIDCYVLRTGLNMLVGPDGSFSATVNGNQLGSQAITLHLEGRFVSSNVIDGSYTVTGNSECTGQPVGFTAAFSSAYQPPLASTGSVTLLRPKGGGGSPGGEKPPEGGECKDLASIAPEFKKLEGLELPIAKFSAGPLPIAVSGSVSFGSVGICDRAINALVPQLEVTPPSLGLKASFDFGDRHLTVEPKYSIVPLGWHVPDGAGAPRPEPPRIDWAVATPFNGEAAPSLDFGVGAGEEGKGKQLTAGLELVKVPIVQPTATLIALGRPILDASIGPELSIGMKVDREAMQEAEEEGVAEGETPQAAAEQIAEQAGTDVQAGIDAETGIAEPAGALSTDAPEIATAVSDDVAGTLTADAAADPASSAIEALLLEGTADTALIGDAEAVVGEGVVDVGVVAIEGRVRHRLPPGLHRSRGRLVVQKRLRARPLHRLRHHSLHRAPFPVRRIAALVHDTFSLPVPVRVGRLATTSTRLRPGSRVSVLAPFLGGGQPHDALLTLAGPNYRAVRLVRIVNGAAGATINLPRRMAHGTWTISFEDLSGVVLAPQGGVTGTAILRLGVFHVR